MFYFRELIYTTALYTCYKVMNKSIVPIAVKRKWYWHIAYTDYYDGEIIGFSRLEIDDGLRRELSLRRLGHNTPFANDMYFYPFKNSKMESIQFFDYCHISNIFFDITCESKKIQIYQIKVPFYHHMDGWKITYKKGMK